MKKNVVLIVFEEKTFIKELVKVHTSVVFEFADNTEQAIEKLNFSAIGAVLVDMSLEIENLRKIEKVAQIFHSEIILEKADFTQFSDLESKVLKIRGEFFKRRMANYNFEDNPNLNNPFLNIDKTNIFKKSE